MNNDNMFIAAHFATGPPPPAKEMVFKSFLKRDPENQRVTVVGESTVQTYRSISDAPKASLIGIYDPDTKLVHFQKAASVTMSHAEVKSTEYMNRFNSLRSMILDRKKMDMRARNITTKLAYGDRRAKGRVKESIFGLKPHRDMNPFKKNSKGVNGNLDVYPQLPFSLPSVNPHAMTPEKVYPYDKIFYKVVPILRRINHAQEDWADGFEEMPSWLKSLMKSYPQAKKKMQNITVYRQLLVFLGMLYTFKRLVAGRNGQNIAFTEQNTFGDEVHVWTLTGSEMLSKLLADSGAHEKGYAANMHVPTKYVRRYFVRLLIAALYLSRNITGAWRIENVQELCADSGMSLDDVKMIAFCNGLRAHKDINDCFWFDTKFNLIFKQEMVGGKDSGLPVKIKAQDIM
uniref:Uncharacterized protein n=1 Tax=Percolomonas cosmopolitus TaxID=63605 RepID=A0A7S1KMM2_9EUKA